MELNANFNKLTTLPDTVGFELINLQKLSVNSNKLSHLPHSTSHMTSLKVLDARLNCLRSLPEGLEKLIRLEVLNVSQNFQYLESLPYSIGLLCSLVELDISYNKITHLPNSIGCLTKLRKFQAEGNPLTFPPIEVVEQSLDAVRDYLNAKMNEAETSIVSPRRKKSWFGKLKKFSTFNAGVSSRPGIMDETDGFLLSDYRSIDGLTSPRHLGLFSPRRLFSPKRTPLRK